VIQLHSTARHARRRWWGPKVLPLAASAITLVLLASAPSACSGEVAASHDAGRLDAAPGQRDSSLDGTARDGTVADVRTDTSSTTDAGGVDSSLYPPPDGSGHRFDGGCSDGCDGGDLCLTGANFDGRYPTSICFDLPKSCGKHPQCECIVEAATWCGGPTCTDDGGVILTCLAPAPP
jgi:hypothetical protein